MLYHLECPIHTQNVKVPDAVNWTATYRYVDDLNVYLWHTKSSGHIKVFPVQSFSDNNKYISILLYRRDSDIVAPYEKWQYYDTRIRQQEQDRNYAANKTKKVAWFVSNCGARNGRLQFAHELGKYIDVSFHFNGFLYRL